MQKICSIMLGMLMATSVVFASSCSTSQNAIEGPFNITINATQGGRVSVPIEQVNFGENPTIVYSSVAIMNKKSHFSQ
jgi:hypothetical protein